MGKKTKKTKYQQKKNQSPISLPPHIQDFSNSNTNIIQWNIQGNANKKADLVGLKSEEKHDVFCIQENDAVKADQFKFKVLQRTIQRRTHGGVALFIHESIPHQKFTLNISLHAIPGRINIGRDVTLVLLYNSRIYNISENLL